MHGVSRTRQSKEVIAARKAKEQAKIQSFLALTDTVLSKKKESDWSREAFDLTTELLHVNPEFYTIWNYRRDILLTGLFPKSTPAQVNDILLSELDMVTALLKQNPKVYWIWNHRRWCLENVPNGPKILDTDPGDPQGWKNDNWDRELFIVEKMLDRDARNFHAWSYRRYVLASMTVPRPGSAELAYTTEKIEANFSNFSAWHQRSRIYMSLWASGNLDPAVSREEEFELIRNAMYTDPNDQSVWVYHRWLIGKDSSKAVLEREIGSIQELLDEEPNSKWCMESLVHYKQQLLQNYPAEIDRLQLKESCLRLLERLKTVDPARKHRYFEIENELKNVVA